jgi:hypothetical protein
LINFSLKSSLVEKDLKNSHADKYILLTWI